MHSLWKAAAGFAAMAAAAVLGSSAASAGVAVGVTVGVPSHYYGAGYYPPGPCDAYTYYYAGDCGYAVYSGPIFVNGARVTGAHYYRWYGGRPLFWYRGGWRTWAGWRGAQWNWRRAPGWGWHDGRWNRAWGRTHWRGPVRMGETARWRNDERWHGKVSENVRLRENARGDVHVRENGRGRDDRHRH